MIYDVKDRETVPCIICDQHVEICKATAGALYADGGQAFACLDHTYNKAAWIVAWAKFAIAQRTVRTSTVNINKTVDA